MAASRHRKSLHLYIDTSMKQSISAMKEATKTERERVLAGAARSLSRRRDKRLALAEVSHSR